MRRKIDGDWYSKMVCGIALNGKVRTCGQRLSLLPEM